jgi:polyisoprenoid-binding protein YceI
MAVARRLLHFGPENGTLLLQTRRTGVASRVGHDLTLELTTWSAEVEILDAADPVATRVEARVDLSSLVVRVGSGGAVPLTDRDRRDIEANARRMLEVDRYPTVTFEADQINATGTEATVDGTLAMHGIQGPVTLNIRQVSPDQWQVDTTVAQTAFGIKPYSAFLGALKLRDEVSVECRVDLTRPGRESAG